MKSALRIATRGSELALWQARTIADQLRTAHPGLSVELRVIQTTGDRILDVPLAKIGDRGLFTKEIDSAVLGGEADLAVHSLKDVPTHVPAGLTLAAVSRRADPRDVLLSGDGIGLAQLRAGARVGTSSLRRRAQLRAHRPDFQIVDLRGNLNTRLAKLDRGEYDAIVLAAAGVERLGWTDRISEYLSATICLSAVGQGALAVVARVGDEQANEMVAPLSDLATVRCTVAEREFLRVLEGGCQIPIAALAVLYEGRVQLEGLIADLDGTSIIRGSAEGDANAAREVGGRLARELAARGGREILERIRENTRRSTPPCRRPVTRWLLRWISRAKILTPDQLVERFARPRSQTVVFTNGCFDLLHRGHVEYLHHARALGDVLVVGLNSDASVRRLKGPDRPVNSREDRTIVLAGLASVDAVTVFDTDTPLELIQHLLPDVLVKGGDYRRDTIVGAEETERAGGQVMVIPLVEGRSSSSILYRVRTGSNHERPPDPTHRPPTG